MSRHWTSDSFSKTIFWTGCSSIRSPCPNTSNSTFWILVYLNYLCHRPLVATGIYCQECNITNYKFSLFLVSLHLDWRVDKNFFYLCQNSLAVCWTCLHCFLLNSLTHTNLPDGSITTLVFMVKMLFGLNGCSLLTSPKVSIVNGLEFNIASVSANSVLKDSSFKLLPCVTNNDIRMFCAEQIYIFQTPPYDMLQEGFYAKWCIQNQGFWESVEFLDGPSLEKPLQVPFELQQNLTHYHNARF